MSSRFLRIYYALSYLVKMTINLGVPYEKNVRARYSIESIL